MVSNMHHHSSGPLKQKNKKHKTGAHKSKHQVNKHKQNKNTVTKHKIVLSNKKSRVNENKRKQIEKSRALKEYQRETGFSKSHIPIAVISLSEFKIENIIEIFKNDDNFQVSTPEIDSNCRDFYTIESKLHKLKIMLFKMTQDTAFYFHDTISASQAIWILLDDKHNEIEELVTLFETFESIHLPPIYHLINFSNNNKKNIQNFLEAYSEDFGALKCDSENIIQIFDGKLNIHKLSKCIPKNYTSSNYVSRLQEESRKDINIICERINYLQNEHECYLEVEGTLRGGELSVNDMISIPGFGNYPIFMISTSNTCQKRSIENNNSSLQKNLCTMDVDDNHITDDDSMVICDKEMINTEHMFFEPSQIKPIEMDIDEHIGSSDSHEDLESESYDEESNDINNFNSEISNIEKQQYFTSLEECVGYGQLLENPYQKRIIEFQNYRSMMKEFFKNIDNNAIKAGNNIKIAVSNFPRIAYEFFRNFFGRLIIHKLFPYEDQLSVVNYFIHKKDSSPDIFSNKKYFYFCGPRRFKATSVFSCLSNSKKSCYKVINKVEGEAYIVATMITHVTFPHSPVVMFSQSDDGELSYIGSGHVMSFSKRLLVNELILEGSVRKAYKKSTVVTGLFRDRDEAEKFKHIEVYTQTGDKGHIVKPIGTHGTVKCHFTLPTLKSQKIIGKLYKPQPLVCDLETEVYIPPNTTIDEIIS